MSPQRVVSLANPKVTALALWGLLILAPLPTASQQTVTLAGEVRGVGGLAIHSVVNLRLETPGGMPVEHQPASTGGQFEFVNLRKATYRLTVTADGFQTLRQEVDLSLSAGTVFLNLFLAPVGKKTVGRSGLPALTDLNAPKRARKEFQKGARALADNRTNDARAHFEKAVAQYPCYARAQTNLGLSLILQREFSRAEDALRKSLECDPGFHDAHIVLAQLLNVQRRFAESEKVLLDGVRLAPSEWEFHYQLGIACFGLGKYADARDEYMKVKILNPTPPPEYHVKIADLHLKLEEYDQAYEQMHAYLRAAPDGRFAEKIRKIVQEMYTAGVLQESQPQPASIPSNSQ